MQQQHNRNQEEIVGDALADGLTGGWYSAGKGLSMMMAKLFAANTYSLLHHRFGTRFITVSTVWWNLFFMGIFYFAAGDTGGRVLFKYHMMLVVGACIYHMVEARRNLRSERKGKRRHSLFIGESLFVVPVARLIVALKLENAPVLRLLTDYGFQKYVEPGFCFLLGIALTACGLPANGFFLMLCGVSMFRLFTGIEKANADAKQQLWDAQHEGEELEEAQEEPGRQARPNRVRRPVG